MHNIKASSHHSVKTVELFAPGYTFKQIAESLEAIDIYSLKVENKLCQILVRVCPSPFPCCLTNDTPPAHSIGHNSP